ncbi:hypothetical protein B4Q13_17420, partial [Lacticaseibacillus rhamnosus]
RPPRRVLEGAMRYNDAELAQRYYAAWNARDLEAILALYGDDIEFSSPYIAALRLSFDGVIFGKVKLRDYFMLEKWDIDETAWVTILEKYKIDAVLWPTAHDVLRHFLVDKRGWKEQYVGIHESLYVKP